MTNNINLRSIPAVDKLISNSEIKNLSKATSENLVKFAIRQIIDKIRTDVLSGNSVPSLDNILIDIKALVMKIYSPSLRSVINASGIILHTNLGRAPLGEDLLNDIKDVLCGYNNLEFNLAKGTRGERNAHAAEIIRYLTGAEDCVVVNNNAAAVLLLLTAFGKRKESIVSRGELIEIGGSFRIPDIMKASGSKMIEVGATNKTKVSDYEKAITERTAVLFKAHRSNYIIKGFTEEVSIAQLAEIGKKHNVISIYDIGSGLLRKVDSEALKDEPDVKEAVDAGVDLVCFSGDKLLGGGQAGIIVGKQKYIDILKKHPLMRALRVCKTTLAILEKACGYYLDDNKLLNRNVLFATLNRKTEDIKQSAETLQQQLSVIGIKSTVYESEGQYGGGTLPDLKLKSYQVRLDVDRKRGKELFHALLNTNHPILSNLKSGQIYMDMLCIKSNEIPFIVESIKTVLDCKI